MDPATIDAARRGDREAQTALVLSLQEVWYRFCLSMLRDPTAALDAAQETGLRFIQHVKRFDGRSSIKTWSLGIAVNVVRESRRSRRASSPLNEVDKIHPAPSPVESAMSAEQVTVLRQLLNELPDRQREAIVLRFFEDLSVEQTAAAMHVAAGTIKATVHQALRALRANVVACGAAERSRVLATDALALPRGEACGLVFLDPPYGAGLAERAIERLQQGGWISRGSLVVIETAASNEAPFPEEALVSRVHGAARITVWRDR